MISKTFRIGDLVRYDDNYDVGIGQTLSIGTIVGWSKDSRGQTRADVDWFNWCGTGPCTSREYFSEILLISGERK